MALSIRITFFAWLFTTSLLAQKLDHKYVQDQNVEAGQLNRDGHFERADKLLENLLLELNTKEFDSISYTLTYQTKAKIVKNLGDYEGSMNLARKAIYLAKGIQDSAHIADAYNTLGVNHYLLSNYDSTSYYYEKALEIKKRIKEDPYSLAVSAYNLALVFEDQGQIEKAISNYIEAERLLLNSEIEKNFLSDVYAGLTHVYFYSGDLTKAEEYGEKAMDVGIRSYGEFNPNMTFTYVSYANVLEARERYDEAIALLEKSLEIRKNTYGEYHRWTCEANYDLANSLMKTKDYDRAETLYKTAIEIGEKINSKQYLANAYFYLASLYNERETNLEEARELLEKALLSNIAVFGNINEIVAANYYEFAKWAMLSNNEDQFFEYVDKSLEASNYSAKEINKVIAPLQSLQTLTLLGEWYEAQYESSGDLDFLKKWFDLLDKQVRLIKYTQRNFSSDRSKIDMANEYRGVIDDGLMLCWKLFHTTKEQVYLDRAFQLSETNRNTTLLEGLQDIKYKLFSDIPEDELQIEEQLRKDLERVKMDLYYEKTASEPNKEIYSSLLNQRIILSNRLDSLYSSFQVKYPRYRDLKYNKATPGISDIQSILDNKTQMLTYFLGEEYLYSFGISNDSIIFLRGNVSEKVITSTSWLKAHLEKRTEVAEPSNDLYMYLLHQQLDHDKENVIIVADNLLNYIPFEVLKNREGEFVIENHALSYVGSARLFLELNNTFFNYELKNQWAGFSPVYQDENQLSSSSDEVSEIARMLGGREFNGEEASIRNFLENNHDFSVLHLAMHAEIDHSNPSYNKLLFSDGELTSGEIYVSKSKANLAILSACDTGLGRLEKGEGVMSMARAFHFAGIPSTVMSLWKVPDQETKKVMVAFYQYLRQGESKNQALRLAKLDYLKQIDDPLLAHPYYWSGFVVNGNISPVDLNHPLPTSLLIALGIISLALIGFQLRKRKKRLS